MAHQHKPPIHCSDERNFAVRYEVHREREPGRGGVIPTPTIETFLSLERARLSALAHALDGPSYAGDRHSGIVRIYEIFLRGSHEIKCSLVDLLDERVVSRILNEIKLPRADDLSFDIDDFQGQIDELIL